MRTLFILAVLLTNALNAQTTFAPIGAKWTYGQGIISGPDTNIAEIEVVGDTVLGGRTCSRLRQNSGYSICYQLMRFIATSGDSLLYWNESTNEFQLLFDRAAGIGGTWSTPISQANQFDTLDWSVIDTGHVVIDGTWLKSFEITMASRQGTMYPANSGTVVDRLGGMIAPFSWLWPQCDAETYLVLRCYEDSEITWLNPQFTQCDLSTGIPEGQTTTELNVYPSVLSAGDAITVSVSPGTTMNVVDATGRIYWSSVLSAGQWQVTLPTSGIYFVRAVNERMLPVRVVVE
jgi:hypothetical protein